MTSSAIAKAKSTNRLESWIACPSKFGSCHSKPWFSGVHYTGMYFNPILASAMTLGCKGASLPTHFLVYWVGPILGWMVGTQLYRRCLAPSPPITADEKKKDD